ncbi:hypothetical protein PO909_027982 [Leuciscus waleckii]
MSVMEGDPVTLHTDLSEIQNDDTILWMFGPKGFVISQITRKNDLTSFFVTDDDVRFRGRLQVDQNTGSLTIRNTRITHSGQYKLSISRKKTTTKIFSVTVFGVVNETDGVKTVSVMEGENVTLNTDTDIHPDDLIVWRFGDKGILLAKIDVGTNKTSLNYADERFRDRLEVDQTGSLTITNTRTEHSGLYELQIRGRESSQRFLLSVNAVPDPGLSPGEIAGIAFAVLLVLVVVVIYYHCTISKLKKEKNVSKKEGHSLTLPTNVTELNKDDKIQWCYEDENNLIAEINKETNETSTYDGADGRFRNKLTLNPQTGDLTINNIRTLHAGLYRLKIRSKMRTKHNRFIVTVQVRALPGKVGEDVTLKADVEIQPDDMMLWTYGAEYCLVARAVSKTAVPEPFRDGLDLDEKTGNLTISNIRPTDSGHYNLQIINSKHTICRRFNVTVTGE